jgi:TonB family protein
VKRSFAPAILLAALAARGAAPVRVPAVAHPIRSVPYPPEAAQKKIEGNVVLTGEVSVAGRVTGLRALSSSAPELTPPALEFVSQWQFDPATEGGKPVPVALNAVVRFRKDSRASSPAGLDPGTMPAPMVGNLVLSPAGRQGQSKRLEGFAVGPDDGGVAGTLDLDLPRDSAAKSYRVVVTDQFPSGRRVTLLDQPVSGGGNTSVTLSFHRAIDPADPAEKGAHEVDVAVDAKEAGGGVYRVGGAAAPAKARKKKSG